MMSGTCRTCGAETSGDSDAGYTEDFCSSDCAERFRDLADETDEGGQTMTAEAVVSRSLQFRAGPERVMFHACAHHRAALARGFGGLFYATSTHAETPADSSTPCDYCEAEP